MFVLVIVWLWLATKGPRGRPSPHWAAEENRKQTGKNWWVRIRAVNRTANKENGNNNGSDKENTQRKQQNAESNSHCPPPLRTPEL